MYTIIQTGASIYQAMSLALACLAELYVCAPVRILSNGFAINENLPAHSHPLGGSVLLQIFCATLYSELVQSPVFGETKKMSTASVSQSSAEPVAVDPQEISTLSITLAEALCSIDEDNKHTDQIDDLLTSIQNWYRLLCSC